MEGGCTRQPAYPQPADSRQHPRVAGPRGESCSRETPGCCPHPHLPSSARLPCCDKAGRAARRCRQMEGLARMLHSLVAVTASTGCEGNAGAVAGCGQHAKDDGERAAV